MAKQFVKHLGSHSTRSLECLSEVKVCGNCFVMKIIFLTAVWCEALKPYKMYVALHPFQAISMIFRKLLPFEAAPADAFNFKSFSDPPPCLEAQT